MPLLDHSHSPLAPRRHWESFHVNWAGAIADALNEHLLPKGYFAEEHAQIGARVGIDVATFDDSISSSPGGGPITTLPARVWTPPAAAMVIPAAFPDRFEVLVFESEGGTSSSRPSSWSAPPTRIATPIARRSPSSAPAISARESA